MGAEKNKRAKRKAYFNSSNPMKKKRWNLQLTPGLKGFICTCNGNEKGCIREALNILDDFHAKIETKTKPSGGECNSQEDEDIEKALKEEVNAEKNPVKKFTPIDTGTNNCIFISSRVSNVLEIGEAVVKDVKDTKIAKSRFLIRLVPVEITCKAYNEDIKKAADSIFDAHFKGERTSYCIHINKRSNNNLLRTEVTDDLARLVRDRNPNHVVDLKTPAKTVVVDIIRNICCLSVVNNFFAFRKYNLIELASKKNSGDKKEGEITSKSSSEGLSLDSQSSGAVVTNPEPSVNKENSSNGDSINENSADIPKTFLSGNLELENRTNKTNEEPTKCDVIQDTINTKDKCTDVS